MAKTIKTPLLHRSFELDRASVNDESRTVELSFSSEAPVERWFGVEILDHSPSSVDLSRLNNGGALLLDHNTRDQIGVVVEKSAKVDSDKKGRAVVRFSKSTRANEIFQDVKDGIRRLVSVGYRIDKMVTEKVEKGVETLRAMSWTPLEISLVSVPADPSVGVGRSEDKSEFTTVIEPFTRNMTDTTPAPAPAAPAPAAPAPAPALRVNEYSAVFTEIEAIGESLKKRGVKGIDELTSRAICEKLDLETFRKEAFKLLPTVQPIRNAEPLDVKPKEWARYSITRAIRMQLPGNKQDGFEREISDEISLKGGARPEGVWVPREAMVVAGQRNFVAGTGTLGGMLVDTQNLGSQFIELLRNRALVSGLGARMINLSNPVTIPRQNAAGAVNWVGETVAATLSTGNFTQITLTPLGLSAFQQYGKQLLSESDPSIDGLIRDDIMNIIALEIDRVVFHGSGSPQPTGITGTTGVTTIALGANGAAFTVANGRSSMVSLETAVATANADIGNLAYVTNAKMRGRLKMIDQNLTTSAADWVWKQSGGRGEVNGYRAEVTNQVSAIQTQGTATTICSSIFYGNWQDILISSFNNGATDLLIDPYTLGANAVVRVIARHWADMAVRHPASFAVLLGALDS
jgi:HK97 family phage major capsid protein/HK97 family phage prohead protease